MDNTKTITHLSLCSGYEGIGLGLRRIFPNLREIAMVEREIFPVENLVTKMEEGLLDSAPIFTDVKTFPYGKFLGKVSILSGGFPCQPFSGAGRKKSTSDERHIFPFIEQGIRECRPSAVFLENVEGILSCRTGDGEPVLQYVLRSLEGLGYRATAGIFSAEECGFPHQRKRVFILAHANDCGSFGRYETESDQVGQVGQHSASGEVGIDAGEEMGYPKHDGCSSSKELQGNPKAGNDFTKGQNQSCESKGASGLNLRSSVQGCEEMAHDSSTGLEGNFGDFNAQTFDNGQAEGNEWGTPVSGLPTEQYPARPEQEQYEWEEPRVIVKSELGGATNGSTRGVDSVANRTERLRLLGNGVVPAVVAKAFITLSQRLL